MTITKKDIKETSIANKICAPWEAITTEREMWQVTLTSGRVITLLTPLGAATELEEKGYNIIAI